MKIFYVVIYHWRANNYSRWLIKGENEEQVKEKARNLLTRDGRIDVCYAPDIDSDFVEL